VREEDAGEREAGAHSTTPTYTVRRDGPAREPSLSAFWLQKPSILRACVREEDAGGREAGAPLDLKMPLENGRADERVSRGQASERAVCVCEAVSVEMGARRPPLPTAVVCLPGRRRRLAPRHNSSFCSVFITTVGLCGAGRMKTIDFNLD
jgi:hypothetical protein